MAKKTPKVRVEDEEGWVHPSRDNTSRFAVDQLIREHGYQILYRKKGKEPVWETQGHDRRQYPQSKVLLRIPEELIRIAEEQELTYFC